MLGCRIIDIRVVKVVREVSLLEMMRTNRRTKVSLNICNFFLAKG